MMQTTNLWNRDHLAFGWRLNFTWQRSISIQRKVRTGFMIILEVTRENAMKMLLVEYDHVVHAFSAYATDHSFTIGILPGRMRCSGHFFNP